MNLMKELPKVAARILKNTRSAHPDMKSRFALLSEAYGSAAVVTDFEEWCEDNKTAQIPYPISAYMKVVDSRLGSAPKESSLNIKDPQVAELVSMTYELTSVLPSAISVAELLAVYPLDEVKAALTEFAEGLTERELKTSMRMFYANGGSGAIAVITARRRQAEKK